MSSRESRDDVRASPWRARSLLTVRAAISSARSSPAPRSSSESLMCSYCRALFDPFTPRGGLGDPNRVPLSSRLQNDLYVCVPGCCESLEHDFGAIEPGACRDQLIG